MEYMYGIVRGDQPESDLSPAPYFIIPFEVIELRKNPTARPPGVCFLTVVFRSTVPVPALPLTPDQQLYWGGDAPIDASLPDMLPFQTGEHHGFSEIGTDRRIGHGAFFETLPETKSNLDLYFLHEVIDLS
jgi:hypothetical protein